VAVLPSVVSEDAFAEIRQDEAVLRPGAERLCQLLGINAAGLTRYQAGSRPVYAAGDLVLKLFPPVPGWPDYRVEAEVLAAVHSRLPAATPRVHAAGDQDGWGYILMSRLSGVPLDAVWDQIPASDRDRLADQLGETIAALHQLPLPAIPGWQPADWPGFVVRRRAQCVSEQRAWGLPELWADQIPGFLDTVALPSGRPVLLHTEIMRQHLLAAEGPDGTWRMPQAITGLRAGQMCAESMWSPLACPRCRRPSRSGARLAIVQDRGHKHLRFAAQPGGPVSVSRLLVLLSSGLALEDLRPDDLVDLRAAQMPARGLPSSEPSGAARKVRPADCGLGSRRGSGLGICDRAQRRTQRRNGYRVAALERPPKRPTETRAQIIIRTRLRHAGCQSRPRSSETRNGRSSPRA
jgi:hypothetical protein